VNTARDARRAEQAGRLVDRDELPPPNELTAEDAGALAWAVKDLCYAAWSSDPQRAVKAADALRRLGEAGHVGPAAAVQSEIGALIAWTDGIAKLIHGEMDAASASFDAAAAAFSTLGQARHAAQTQVPKIMALAMLGRNEEAARCAQAAERALLEHGDLHAASKVSLNLGNLLLRSDRYADAARQFAEAAAMFARSGDHEHSVMVDLGLADALTALGNFDEALRMYARARARSVTHGFPVLQTLAEESVALLELVRGRYRDALAGLEAACRRYAKLQMPQHLAIAERQLANAYLELRLLPEALAGFDTALARFRALEMQVDQAWTLAQRGRALALAGQRMAAAGSLVEAVRLFIAQGNTLGVAAVTLARAELALAADQTDQALELAGAAVDGFGRAGQVDRQLRAQVIVAQAMLRRGDVQAARKHFDTTLDAARAHQLLPVQLRCLTGRAMAAGAAGDPAAARADLQAAVELFEDQHRTLPGDEVRSAFQNDHLLPFRELLRLELQAHEAGHAAAAAVLAQLDRFRARTLADRLGAAAADAEDGDEAQRAATRELRARLAWLYRRAQRVQDMAPPSAALTAELRAAEHELLERARRTRLAGAAAAPASDGAEFDVAALKEALAPSDVLVEYGVLDDELFACVVSHDGVHVQRRLAAWSAVRDAVWSARFQLEAFRHGSARIQRHLGELTLRAQAHLQRLHACVWEPLTAWVAGRRRVLVVPLGALGSIPFAALHDGTCCVAERQELALAPSARFALRALARRPAAIRSVLAIGDSARLPHAGREAQAVAALLPRGTAFVGDEATVANLRAHCAGADVVHLACHAQFHADSPLFSALHLRDEVLSAESIESLRLPGAVVVLSGCETALHGQEGGDEMFGLTRAFLLAGAARVVASLWPVDDAVTAEWMGDFYAALRRGDAPAAALRAAQLGARRRHEHPFYWASFAIVGGW
jgi:CHAT domain-containing protein